MIAIVSRDAASQNHIVDTVLVNCCYQWLVEWTEKMIVACWTGHRVGYHHRRVTLLLLLSLEMTRKDCDVPTPKETDWLVVLLEE